jgi:hypothetical protein
MVASLDAAHLGPVGLERRHRYALRPTEPTCLIQTIPASTRITDQPSSPGHSYNPVYENIGGAMASTWSVLRMSCKRRSPVGLLKQPEQNASAENNLALAA